jgi:hypothetical protein
VTLAVFLVLYPGIRLRDLIVASLACSLPILIIYIISPDLVLNFFHYRVGSIGEISRNPNFATSGRWGSWSALFSISPFIHGF